MDIVRRKVSHQGQILCYIVVFIYAEFPFSCRGGVKKCVSHAVSMVKDRFLLTLHLHGIGALNKNLSFFSKTTFGSISQINRVDLERM